MTDISAKFTHTGTGIRAMDAEIIPYRYSLTASIQHTDDEPEEDDIVTALKKIHHFLDVVLASGLAISIDNDLATILYREDGPSLENPPILFPDEPTDAMMATILFHKLNAFMGPRLFLSDLTFKEETGAGISFTVSGEDEILPSMEEWMGDNYFSEPWWHRDDPTVADLTTDDPTVKPVHAMSWGMAEDRPKTEVIRPSFKPTIIDGKKND